MKPTLTEWQLDKLDSGVYELRLIGDLEAYRIFTSFPTEEQIEAALAMMKVLR